MKRIIKAASDFNSELTNFQTYIRNRQKFAIHQNESTNTNDWKATISEIHPYSEAEYVWARIGYKEPMSVEYIQDGEVIEYEPGHRKEFRMDWRDFYEDADEYIRETIERVCGELRDYNRDVESVIGYD